MRRDFRAGTVGRLVGAGLSSLLLAGALVVVPTPAPAEAVVTAINIGDDLASGFTFLSYGNAKLGNSETEGSIAVVGTATMAAGYPIIHSSGLTPTNYLIPRIDGDPTRFLASAINWDASAGASDVTSRNWVTADHKGYFKLAPGASYSVNPRGSTGLWISKQGTPSGTTPGFYVPDDINQPASRVPSTGAVSSYLDYDNATALIVNQKLATQAVEDATTVTLQPGSHGGARKLTLVANKVNFVQLGVDNTFDIEWGSAVRPSATTPIVFNVPVANGDSVRLPKFASAANDGSPNPNSTNPNVVAPYVTYNFVSASSTPISYTIGGTLVSGMIFAPDNDNVTIDASSPIEGQILVNNVITKGGEFHHYGSRSTFRMDLPSPAKPLDLALTKKVASFDRAAGTVTFNLQVFNQSATETANGVTITDYIDSSSFSIAASLLTNGTSSGHAYTWSNTSTATPSVYIAGALAPGATVTIPVTLRAKQPLNLAGLKNTAEISRFDNDGDASNGDSNSATPTVYDVDSRQDATNDDVVIDDETSLKRWNNTEPGVGTQTTAGDEDDHDVAVVPVYDVALIKKRATGTNAIITNPANPLAPTATFDITVKNQGNWPVYNVGVLDSPVAPMTRPASIANQTVAYQGASGSTTVTYNAGTFTIPSLPAGASVTFQITTNLDLNNLVQVNKAEVTGFDDDGNAGTTPAAWVFDRDATNNANPADDNIVPGTNPTFPEDSHNDINHDAVTQDPADEDDHDAEAVQLGLLRLGSTVYIDANGDDIGQASEVVPGVLVVLQKWNGTTWVAAGSTVTNASGDYLFTGLFPGTYRVGLPTAQTGAGVNATALSDTQPVSSPSSPTENVNFDNDGAAQPNYLSVTSNVVLDYGTEATTDGLDESRFGSAYSDTNSNLNIDFVFERYTYEIGNLVWLDNGAGTNFDNGRADSDERGISGVTVELYRDNGAGGATANDGILAASERIGTPVVTDANGFYRFKDLPAANDYVVAIVKTSIPQNLAPSSVKASAGVAPTVDNDNNAFNTLATLWTSGPVAVGPGASSEPTGEKDGTTGTTAQPLAAVDARADQTVDFGFVPSVRIGNQVWLDESDSDPSTQASTDNNGRFDAGSGEVGLNGVTVQLWLDANNNGIFERGGADGATPIATTATNAEGNYWFSGVRPDRPYFVVVPSIGSVGPLRPASSDGQSAGVDALDNDDDGAPVGADLSVSRVFTPTFGSLPTNEADAVEPGNAGQTTDANAEAEANANGTSYADANSDLRIDFGFVDVPLYRLGNLVWLDNGGTAAVAADEADGQADLTEPGIAGVTVTLYKGSDTSLVTPLATAVTDANGEYAFEGLVAGDYLVAVGKTANASVLAGLTSVRDGAAANADVDNDDNGVDGSTAWVSSVVTLGAANAYTGAEPTNEARRAGDSPTYDNGLSWTASTADQAKYANNRSNLTVDFGFAPIYRVGNLVWFDRNNDGLANADEPGLGNVTVSITNGAGINRTTTTDSTGHYVFADLPAGAYTITVSGVTLPAGLVPGGAVVTGNADDDADNDNNAEQIGANYVATVTLGGAEPTTETRFVDDATDDDNDASWLDTASNLSVDFGFWSQLRLGNVVWIDESDNDPSTVEPTDNNGELDPGELPLKDVVVTLWSDVDGNGVAEAGVDVNLGTDTTDAEGNYLFTGLAEGDYVVTIASLPGTYATGYISSLPTALAGDNLDRGATTPLYIASSGIITLVAGNAPEGERDAVPAGDDLAEDEATNGGLAPRDSDSDLTIDFGFVAVPTYRIGNLVWLDADRDGVADASESGISGVLVQLLDDGGSVIQETVTGADGEYDFDGLAAGDYRVRIPGDQLPTLGSLPGIAAGALDELVATIYAGDADAVVTDSDSNGIGAGADFVSAPVTVGRDELNFETEPTIEINPFTGSDDDLGWSEGTDGRSEFTVDFGFWPQLRLGNIVWIDEDADGSSVAATDNNGFLDDGETLLENVDVEVWNVGVNGTFDGGTGDDVVAGTDTTDAEGNWLVTGLPEGTYVAAIRSLPAGFENLVSSLGQFTGDNFDHGNAQTGFVAVSQPVALTAGGAPLGEQDELPSGDTSAEAEANAAGRTLRDVDSDLTLDFSFVTSPLYRIGNLVWLDSNRNGIADAGEPGIRGVLVELVRDGSVIATDVTDVAGTYSFENLAAGDYVVRIPQSQPVEVPGVNVNALKGLALTSLGGVTDVDNDSNGSTVTDYYESDTVTLGGSVSTFETESDEEVNRNGGDDDLGWAGGTDTRSDFTVDFGFFNGLRLGDLVWFDTNDNGVRDAGELPVPGGVPVYLYDEDPTGASAAPIATTLTNSQGVYVFTGLDEFTTYWVAIPGSEIESGALVGYRPSTPTPSLDGAGTNNLNHGAAATDFSTVSSPVNLVRGGMAYGESADEPRANTRSGLTLADGDSNLTVDLGFSPLPTYRLGNLVWLDLNENGQIDSGEPGISGVTVKLYKDNGDNVFGAGDTLSGSTTTSSGGDAGRYAFADLEPAGYFVVIEGGQAPLSGRFITSPTAVSADDDSDLDNNGAESGSDFVSTVVHLGNSDGVGELAEPTDEADANTGHGAEDGAEVDERSNLTVDFGFVDRVRIGNQVWLDESDTLASTHVSTDNDGVFNGTESGLTGVEVELWLDVDGNGFQGGATGSDDQLIDTDTTDAEGNYLFAPVKPGQNYFVAIADIAGLDVRSSAGQSASAFAQDNDDDGAPVTGYLAVSKAVVPVAGSARQGEADFGEMAGTAESEANARPSGIYPDASSALDVDFGFVNVPVYRIGNLVWLDANNNGTAEATEPAIPGVLVQLLSSGGVVIAETVTDSDGHYVFEDLVAGTYSVRIPASQTQALGGGLAVTDGALDHLASSTTETVAADLNADNDDNGVKAGTGPSIVWASGSVVLGSSNDAVTETEPTNEAVRAGGADEDSGWANGTDARSNLTVDFGFYQLLRLGDTVWLDNGGDGASYDPANEDNGVLDAGEPGIRGVVVRLIKDGGNGTLDETDVSVGTAVTDINGKYYFVDLEPGTYFALISASQQAIGQPLAGTRSSTGIASNFSVDNRDQGEPGFSSAATSKAIVMAVGSMSNGDTLAEPAADTAKGFTVPDASSNLAVDFGFVSLPTYALGNLVWEDLDNDGTADLGEPGIDGVTVVLYSDDDENGILSEDDTEIASTTTANGGRYVFTGLPRGDYLVAVPSQEILDGLFVGGTASSAEDVDNDNNALTAPESGWVSPVVTLGGPAGPADHDEPEAETDGIDNADAEADVPTRDDRSNQTIDFGFWSGLRLGNQLWLDNGGSGASYNPALEDNGVYDSVETPLTNVVVQLYSLSRESIVASTTTDSNGRYFFSGIDEGEYRVIVPSVGVDLRSSTGTVGTGLSDDGVDDGAPAPTIAARSGILTLVSGAAPTDEKDGPGAGGDSAEDYANDVKGSWRDEDSFLTVDFGFSPTPGYALGNLVWEDVDNDGRADSGETGIDGLTVQLFRADGSDRILVASTTTAGGGRYLFEGLAAGDYEVRVPYQAALAGWRAGGTPTIATDVDNDNNAISALLGGWASPLVTLGGAAGPADHNEPTGERDGIDNADAEAPVLTRDDRSNQTVDFGFWRGLRLGNQVWLDEGSGNLQDNGVYDDDPAEVGIGGVTVDLFEDDGDGVFEPTSDALFGSTATNADGRYYFEHLPVGSYFVAIKGTPEGTTSSSGRTGNGIGDDGEDDGAPAGSYVAVSEVLSLTVGGAQQGEIDGPGATGGSAEATANAAVGTYADSSSYLTVDFGVMDVPLYRIGNLVWFDANNNGIAEVGEPALGGVLVQLLDEDGAVIGETVTNNQGRYVFTNLLAGTYRVQIPFGQTTSNAALAALVDRDALVGMIPSTNVSATAGADNDANGVETIGVNARSGLIVLGAKAPVNETERAGLSTDDDLGQESPRIEDFRSDFSVDFGFYSISLGNLIFFDRDGDGEYEPTDGDIGIDGVTVRLVRADTGETAQTTTTHGGGKYLFTGLREGEKYYVSIDASNFQAGGALNGYFSSAGVAGGSTSDSTLDGPDRGVDPATPYGAVVSSGVITATATGSPLDDGEDDNPDNDDIRPDPAENLIVDFGFYRMQLGGTLFVDSDNDGALDDDEVYFPGVTVLLYHADGTPYLLPNGTQYSLTTDANGDYVFTGLPAGAYIVEIPASNFAPAGVLEDWANSDGNGTNPDVELNNLDIDDGAPVSGDIFSGGPVRSTVLTIVQGSEAFNDGETTPAYLDSMSNLTVDFGFWHAQAGLEIGNQLWFDTVRNGVFDEDEKPAPAGIEIKLIDAETNEVIATTYSDEKGQYLFTGLDAGRYVVWITGANFIPGEPLAGWTPTDGAGAAADPSDGTDSDSNALALTTTGVRSAELVLKAAAPTGEVDSASEGVQDRQSNLTVDFGFVRAPVLAFTGADVEGSLRTVALLVALGALLLIGSRRRKES